MTCRALYVSVYGFFRRAGLEVRRARRARLAFWVVGVLALFAGWPATVVAAAPVYPCDNERMGFGVTGDIGAVDVVPLHAGWYVNWGVYPTAPHPGGMDYSPIVQISDLGYSPSGQTLLERVDRNPGSLWLVGNEPDNPWQNNVRPENYARIYHDVYYLIKGRDPSAQVAIAGVTQGTSLRLLWLDRVLEEYFARYGEMIPVDVWNVHAFVLREVREDRGDECAPHGAIETGSWGARIPPGLSEDCGRWIEIGEVDRVDLLREDIVRFRAWMRDHGQQNKPLVVSEYAVLFPEELGYDYPRVREFMLWTFNYFLTARDPQLGYPADDYRLVQRWAWYSLDDTSFGFGTTHGALMDPTTGELLPLGRDFARYNSELAAQCSPYVDLQPSTLRASTPSAIRFGDLGLVKLELEVRNQGTSSASPSLVSLWDGDPDAGGTLLGTMPVPTVPPRYQGTAKVGLDWMVKAYGPHTITAIVDSAGAVVESREDNNRLSYTVNFGTINLAASPPTWQLQRGPIRSGETTQILLNAMTVTMTQVTQPSPGLTVLPVPYQAAWWDGYPGPDTPVIARYSFPAPKRFGTPERIPAKPWESLISVPRTLVFTLSLDNDAPETTLDDNRIVLKIPATTDLSLTNWQVVGGMPLGKPGAVYDVPVRFLVSNAGTLPPDVPVLVALRQGTGSSGLELGRAGLEPLGNWTKAITWRGLGTGLHPFTARVDPDNATLESREDNNTLSGAVLVASSRRYLPLSLRR